MSNKTLQMSKEMHDDPRTFLVEVTQTKTFRVTVGGPNGSIRLDGEEDEEAAADMVDEHAHLHEVMLPIHIKLDYSDTTIEEVREIIDSKPLAASLAD